MQSGPGVSWSTPVGSYELKDRDGRMEAVQGPDGCDHCREEREGQQREERLAGALPTREERRVAALRVLHFIDRR